MASSLSNRQPSAHQERLREGQRRAQELAAKEAQRALQAEAAAEANRKRLEEEKKRERGEPDGWSEPESSKSDEEDNKEEVGQAATGFAMMLASDKNENKTRKAEPDDPLNFRDDHQYDDILVNKINEAKQLKELIKPPEFEPICKEDEEDE